MIMWQMVKLRTWAFNDLVKITAIKQQDLVLDPGSLAWAPCLKPLLKLYCSPKPPLWDLPCLQLPGQPSIYTSQPHFLGFRVGTLPTVDLKWDSSSWPEIMVNDVHLPQWTWRTRERLSPERQDRVGIRGGRQTFHKQSKGRYTQAQRNQTCHTYFFRSSSCTSCSWALGYVLESFDPCFHFCIVIITKWWLVR